MSLESKVASQGTKIEMIYDTVVRLEAKVDKISAEHNKSEGRKGVIQTVIGFIGGIFGGQIT